MTAQDSGQERRVSMERSVGQPFPSWDRNCQFDGWSKGALNVVIPARLPEIGRTFPVGTKAALRQSHLFSTSDWQRWSERGDGTQDVLEETARDHDLGKLEGDGTPMADGLGADFHQSVP